MLKTSEREHKYEVVLKEKTHESEYLNILIDEYHLDFIAHGITGYTQLNLFCIVYDGEGKVSDLPECQAFAIPWDNILYIRQMHGIKSMFDKTEIAIDKARATLTEIAENAEKVRKEDMSVS